MTERRGGSRAVWSEVDLEAIRGAASGELIRALMERNLVKIAGREEIPGAMISS